MMFTPNQFYYPYNTFNNFISLNPVNTETHFRSRFTKSEDDLLKQLVESQKQPNWREIASHLKNRTARQCRERYNYYLRPNLVKSPWTPEEDQLLLELYEKYGPKWAFISQSFCSRSPVNIKNHHSSLVARSALQNIHIKHENVDENNNSFNFVNNTEENTITNEINENKTTIVENTNNETNNNEFEDMFSTFEMVDDLLPNAFASFADEDLNSF